ncbi:MAG: PIN domain-containing protein [Bryobacterales bacterium]|nr:PIN domain-containing protein [Bryobacterales bacterium]
MAQRALPSARLSGRLTTQQQRAALPALQRFVRRCYIVSISEQILAQAAHLFPVEPVRTLDAIHLATVQAVSEAPGLWVVVTRDQRIRDNAIALGYSVE